MRAASPRKSRSVRLRAGIAISRSRLQPTGAEHLTRETGACTHGREGAEEAAQHVVADAVPCLAQGEPGLTVTGCVRVQPRRSGIPVPVEHAPAAAAERVSEDGRRVRPREPVLLETEPADGRRRGGQGVEGA